jgi:uncharacterized protein
MISLPIVNETTALVGPTFAESTAIHENGEAENAEPLLEVPWLHPLPGVRPLAFLVRGSQLFEVDQDTFKRLCEGDEIARRQLQALEPPGHELDLENVNPPPAPTAISLHVAQACNLTCNYCYADEGRFQGVARMMPESVAVRALDNLFDSARPGSRLTVGFIGGEPFLNRGVLYRSVEYSRKRSKERQVAVGFSVTTNGTMLNAADLRLLRDNAFAVSVSLDGDERTHDRHRRRHDGSGTWQAILDRLEPLLKDPGPAKLAARATITRDDLRVAERVAALGEAGFAEVGVSPARTGPAPALLLHGADWDVYLHEMIRAAGEELIRLRAAGTSAGWRFSNLGMALKEIHRGTCRPLPCGAGHGYVSINSAGDYYTCHRTLDDPRFKLGHAAGPEFAKRQQFLEARHVDRQMPCRSCWARYLCGGGCHAEVASSGRAGCDMIRGWLEYCLRLYNIVVDEFPQLFAPNKEPCLP